MRARNGPGETRPQDGTLLGREGTDRSSGSIWHGGSALLIDGCSDVVLTDCHVVGGGGGAGSTQHQAQEQQSQQANQGKAVANAVQLLAQRDAESEGETLGGEWQATEPTADDRQATPCPARPVHGRMQWVVPCNG